MNTRPSGPTAASSTQLGLLLERDDGGPDPITGEDFADIFRRNGDPPHLVFLSACHSGELGERGSWPPLAGSPAPLRPR